MVVSNVIFILLTYGKYKLAGGHLYKVLYHCWKVLQSVYYCAFHKKANSDVQKPTNVCVFRCRQSS